MSFSVKDIKELFTRKFVLTYQNQSIELIIDCLPASRKLLLATKMEAEPEACTKEILQKVVRGWKGVLDDESGDPAVYDPEILDKFLGIIDDEVTQYNRKVQDEIEEENKKRRLTVEQMQAMAEARFKESASGRLIAFALSGENVSENGQISEKLENPTKPSTAKAS